MKTTTQLGNAATEFEGLTLDSDAELLPETFSTEKQADKHILSSIFEPISVNTLNKTSEYTNKLLSASKTYLINPLLDIWHTVARTSKTPLATTTTTDADEKKTEYYSNKWQEAKQTVNKAIDDKTKKSTDVSGNFDAYNNSDSALLPSANQTSKYNSHKIRAKLAFQNAFLKYSNLMSKMYTNNRSSDGGGGGVEANLNADTVENVTNVEIVMDRIDENDNGEDSETETVGETVGEVEDTGIFVLEIFGTIVGLAWGTISQIQSLFQRN